MTDNFQRVIQDNICLKKNLQVTRHQNQKLLQEVSQLRLMYQEILDKNTALNEQYNRLQKKQQLQIAEHNKDVSNFNSQIAEMKQYIDQKQLELQNFQLKMIPNLDQDMLRVKLITEMEGPYQQITEKKDKEILRLKEKMSAFQRKSNLYEMQLETKEKQFKRQLEETRRFYQSENEKIHKELNMAVNKKQVKSYDKEIFKSQRRQLEELRCTLQLQIQNQAELRKQLGNLKIEKEKLLIQMAQLNEKKALEMHLSSENEEICNLKQQKKKLQQDIERKNEQIQKLEKKYKSLQKQQKSNEEQHLKILRKNTQQWQIEKDNLKQDLAKEKQQHRRAKDKIERFEEQIHFLSQKVKNIDRQMTISKNENQKMKHNLNECERIIKQYQISKKQKLSLSKNIQDSTIEKPKRNDYIEQSNKKQNDHKQTNIINKKQQKEENKYVKELEKNQARLKEKLEEANRKIVQLLKEKAGNFKKDQKPALYSNSRDRAFSNVEIDSMRPCTDKAFLLQFRDTSFTPLVPPTIFTQPN